MIYRHMEWTDKGIRGWKVLGRDSSRCPSDSDGVKNKAKEGMIYSGQERGLDKIKERMI